MPHRPSHPYTVLFLSHKHECMERVEHFTATSEDRAWDRAKNIHPNFIEVYEGWRTVEQCEGVGLFLRTFPTEDDRRLF